MKLPVLDHGYVEFIEAWGHGKEGEQGVPYKLAPNDLEVGIIEAARQSTQKGFQGWEKDEKLLKYLYQHNHLSPFEFAGLIIEVQAPIFVFREWQRHRTQSYNEMSARYEPLPDLYYVPSLERVMMKQGTNKQTQGINNLTEDSAIEWLAHLTDYEGAYHQAERTYKTALEQGIPKELARCIMPVGHYSRMRASASLRNWLQFLTLRLDPAAQWEIRQFASAVGQIIQAKFPRTWTLFQEKSSG